MSVLESKPDSEYGELARLISREIYGPTQEKYDSVLPSGYRICRDGGVAGDSFPELLAAITAKFGTDFSDIPDYGGPELGATPWSIVRWLWDWWRGHEDPDVTIAELHEAVKAGSWAAAFPERTVREA